MAVRIGELPAFTLGSAQVETAKTVEMEAADQLHTDLWEVYQEQMLCDFTLVAAEGKEFRTHKVILAARSKPLRAMVESKMKEGIEGRAELKDVQSDVMEEFLRFLYTGKVTSNLPKEVAMSLFQIADKYEVLSLVPLCVKQLKKLLKYADNTVDILNLADVYNNEDLKRSCMDYLTYNHTAVRKTEQWRSLLKRKPKLYEEVVEKLLDGSSPPKFQTFDWT